MLINDPASVDNIAKKLVWGYAENVVGLVASIRHVIHLFSRIHIFADNFIVAKLQRKLLRLSIS